MAQDYARAFYNSKQWETTRKLYMQSVNGLCEDCLAKGIYTPGKIVHHIQHITPANIGNINITLNPDNLRLVCQDCHAKEHAKGADGLRYKFDENGELIYFPVPPVEKF